MDQKSTPALSGSDLNTIRDAVPALDLFAIRSLRRAGFQIVKNDGETDDTNGARARQNLNWDETESHVSSAA